MKEFVCTEETLKHIDPASGVSVFMSMGSQESLPDEVVDYFCKMGWGFSEGVTNGARSVGAKSLVLNKSLSNRSK